MDTSKEYINMCEAADEIQGLPRTKMGRGMLYFRGENLGIWLPAQDQLQGRYKDQNITHLTYEFYRFCFGPQFARAEDKVRMMEYSIKFKSMDQLWLGFIMQEEYGKRWDGEKWVNE